MVSGFSARAATLPRKSRRQKRSCAACTSPIATWASSWFMSEYIRSLAGKVSKARDSGAMSKMRRLRGADIAAALP
jgi:hypothetical protein